MIAVDPHLLVRAGTLYFAAVTTVAAWAWRRPSRRQTICALLTSLWNFPVLLALNVVAIRAGWWHYEAAGGLFLGVPLDLLLSWSVVWGAVSFIVFEDLAMPLAISVAVAVDVALMPLCVPVLRLGPAWLIGETVAIASAFTGSLLLGRWTIRSQHLVGRALLQMTSFVLIVMIVPATTFEWLGDWSAATRFVEEHGALAMQFAIAPGLIGVSAVQEFVTRGHGTPVPFDPPQRLVTSGLYRYVRNPMQLSALLMLAAFAALLEQPLLLLAAIIAHTYSVGIAGWDEDRDLDRRFGSEWREYRASVPRWRPRWRPWIAPHAASSRLYVGSTCDVCRPVAVWFEARHPIGLEILPAESHAKPLRRITYEFADGTSVDGVHAIERALEHLSFGWALAGAFLRLPGVRMAIQLLVDASGGGPRTLPASGAAPRVDDGGSRC